MLVSITAGLFAYIRREVTFGNGLPFGAFLQDSNSIILAFSGPKSFWELSTITGPENRERSRRVLACWFFVPF